MGLKQITYDQILKKGNIQPSEKTELTEALDLGGGNKATWFVEDGYTCLLYTSPRPRDS